MDTVHRLHLRSDVSPDNVGVLSCKSSAGGYSGILKRKTQLGDISADVQPFLLSDEACWRVEAGALYLSRVHCSQTIGYASPLYNCDVLSGNLTDSVVRVARDTV